jgi:alpha-ribazole phosphatase
MHLTLVRHPKPLAANGLCYGRLDIPCEPEALVLATARLATLAARCTVVSSPALRAFSLARKLTSNPSVEPRLQELDFGDWEGCLWQDLGRDAVDHWLNGLPFSAPPNGESLAAMAERLAAWLTSLAGEQDILAITHAGPIRVLQALVKREPLMAYFDRSIPYAEPMPLEVEGPFPVGLEINETK